MYITSLSIKFDISISVAHLNGYKHYSISVRNQDSGMIKTLE